MLRFFLGVTAGFVLTGCYVPVGPIIAYPSPAYRYVTIPDEWYAYPYYVRGGYYYYYHPRTRVVVYRSPKALDRATIAVPQESRTRRHVVIARTNIPPQPPQAGPKVLPRDVARVPAYREVRAPNSRPQVPGNRSLQRTPPNHSVVAGRNIPNKSVRRAVEQPDRREQRPPSANGWKQAPSNRAHAPLPPNTMTKQPVGGVLPPRPLP